MTNRCLAIITTAFLLILLVGTQVMPPQIAYTASNSTQSGWWNDAFQFRRTITVSNQGSAPIFNQTVIAPLNFTGSYAQDALASVRLVDSSGSEVPSALVGPRYSGIFLMSAYLVFSADIPANSNSVYDLYFGASFQSVPSYRSNQLSSSVSNGFVAVSLQSLPPDSSLIQLGLGTVDTETTMSKVTYTLGGTLDYGPTDVSLQPFSNDTGLISAGQIGSASTVAYEMMQAGAVHLTRILVLSANGVVTIDAVASDSSSTITNVRLTTLVGLGGLSTLGASNSAYDVGAAVLSTKNTDGNFVVTESPSPASYTLGPTAQVTSEAKTGVFNGVTSYPLASAAAFAWDLGDLQPAAATWVASSWGVASGGQAIPPIPLSGGLGQLEVLNSATPRASSIWSSTATIVGVPIPASGVAIPFGIGPGTLIPDASSVNGTYAYTYPPSSQQDPHSWTSVTTTTGNASALASPQYYDFATGLTISRVLTYSPGTTSKATASLTSLGGFNFGGTSDVLKVKYKASFNTISGNFSAQSFFIAADFDPTLRGIYNQSVYLPVSGSSTTLPADCQSQQAESAQVVPSGLLIGDNTWRTLSMGLPPWLPASGFDVRIRACISSSPGFTGTMDLEVASAGVVHVGTVSAILQPVFSHTVPELTLSYLPQAQPLSTVGVTTNLTVSLVFQANSSIGWADGSTFDGTIAPSTSLTLNDSALRRSATLGLPRLEGVLVSSAVSQFAQVGQVNGTSVPLSANPGVMFLDTGGSTTGSSTVQFKVGFTTETLQVQVLDQDKIGVGGVTVVLSANGVNLPLKLLTDSSGGVKVQLIPWTYHFNATYQGVFVGSADVQAAQSSVSIPANIYQLTLLVKDNRGGLLSGAQVALTIGNLTLTGTTNNQGRYPFEAVANTIYGLTVGFGSGTYFSGQIGATANNAVVEVTTTYLPASAQLTIAILLAIIPVALIVAYYAARRLRPSR